LWNSESNAKFTGGKNDKAKLITTGTLGVQDIFNGTANPNP